MEIIYMRIASNEEPKKEDGAADGEKWRSYVDQTNLLSAEKCAICVVSFFAC
jgi:hypothetical protein